jgi:hypothetical protein
MVIWGTSFKMRLILPLIDYCCVVWGNCSNEGLNHILKLQKRTARLILDQDPIAPSEPLFKQLGWMSIEQRIKYHQYLLKMRLLTFILNALWEEACHIENGSSFHSFGPEHVKVFLKSSVFAFGRVRIFIRQILDFIF